MRNHNCRSGRNPKSFQQEKKKKNQKEVYMERVTDYLTEFQDSGYVGIMSLQMHTYYRIGGVTKF